MTGFFITLEGGEGAGKTTHGKRLVEWLQQQGHEVITCRDPGTTDNGLAIRELILKGDGDRWLPVSEVLLFNAARHDVVERRVKPALAAGKIVVYDRFCDSTYVYQGYGRGYPLEDLLTVQRMAIGNTMPDLTLVFDVDADTALARSKGSTVGEDRFESIGRDFHTRIQQGYRELVENNPDRCVLIDATKPLQVVEAEMLAMVKMRLLEQVT